MIESPKQLQITRQHLADFQAVRTQLLAKDTPADGNEQLLHKLHLDSNASMIDSFESEIRDYLAANPRLV